MGSEITPDLGIEPAFVRMQPAFLYDVLGNDLADGFLVGDGGMERSDLAAALDQRDDRALVGRAGATLLRWRRNASPRAWLRAVHLAVIGFVCLNNLAIAAERRQSSGPHALTDAVRHEPGGLIGHVERAVQLVRRDALL